VNCNIGVNSDAGEDHAFAFRRDWGFAALDRAAFWATTIAHEVSVHIGPYTDILVKLAANQPLTGAELTRLRRGGEAAEHANIHATAEQSGTTLYGRMVREAATQHRARYRVDDDTDVQAPRQITDRQQIEDMYDRVMLTDVSRYQSDGGIIRGTHHRLRLDYLWAAKKHGTSSSQSWAAWSKLKAYDSYAGQAGRYAWSHGVGTGVGWIWGGVKWAGSGIASGFSSCRNRCRRAEAPLLPR
jgi:hypothetical protein